MKTIFIDLGGTLILNDQGSAVINKNLFDTLEELKNDFQLVILSDTNYDVTDLLENFGITKSFDPLVITKYLFPIDKSKPETYQFACEKAGTVPNDCLLIDNEEGFVQAAKQAGLQTVPPTDPDLDDIISSFLSS